MTAQIKQLPPTHHELRHARITLRNHRLHDLDAMVAAFEVLAYSPDEADRALCRVVADEMWFVPTPGVGTIIITMIAVALTCVGVATLVGRLML